MLAFPGAEGFGKNTVGGRGGTVLKVTNLNDSGAGSFREAVTASGPRTVVSEVGGEVDVLSQINVTNPYLTIAMQTAPGGGLMLKGNISHEDGLLVFRAPEIICRYLRLRRGRHTVKSLNGTCLGIGSATTTVENVIADHCSMSWATDELATIWYDAQNITFQWCIMSECLEDADHTDGPHSMGLIAGSTSQDISVLRNLIAHNNWRNPQYGSPSGLMDIVNNLIYNPGSPDLVSELAPADIDSGCTANVRGNYMKAGVDTEYGDAFYVSGDGPYYVVNNICPARPTDAGNENLAVRPADQGNMAESEYTVAARTVWSPTRAYDGVLAGAGCNSRLMPDGDFQINRDSVDERIVNDVKNGTGSIIDDPSEVGGFPTLSAGTAPTDTDGDGMPDEWELANGLDPNDPSDGPIIRANGYSNLEHFLNGMQLEQAADSGGVSVAVNINITGKFIVEGEEEMERFWQGYFADVKATINGILKSLNLEQ